MGPKALLLRAVLVLGLASSQGPEKALKGEMETE